MRSHVVLKLLRVLRHLAHGKQWDRELSEEMEAHREMKRGELEKEGYNPAEVESAVRRELGNVTQMKEEARAVWMWPWLEGLAQDLRMEVRQLSHAPGFTLTAVAILALGIGLNAAVFTVLNRVVLRPFPLPHLEKLTYGTAWGWVLQPAIMARSTRYPGTGTGLPKQIGLHSEHAESQFPGCPSFDRNPFPVSSGNRYGFRSAGEKENST